MYGFDKIKKVLGEPFYENELVQIYNMDCREGLIKLADSDIKVDATITSPPYNIGKEYEKIVSLDKYIDWISDINNLIFNATKDDGAYLLNIGYLKVDGK